MQAIRYVRQFPPKALLSMEVNFESRYGMYCYFCWVFIYYRARMTFRRKNKDLLISMASLLSLPTGLNILSDPARSTNTACLYLWFPSSSWSFILTTKTEWDREEYSLILLLAITLFLLPTDHSFIIASADPHSFSISSSIINYLSAYHRILRYFSC